MGNSISSAASCISFDSYIKPQLGKGKGKLSAVVYLLIPTSNHNTMSCLINTIVLYIFWFLHQTTTCDTTAVFPVLLYIFWFLHQTTTCSFRGCWSQVVYLLIPTSNHNQMPCVNYKTLVVYLLIPTSNHNCWFTRYICAFVVYLLIPTSNHNPGVHVAAICWLYIFWFLHQTTTPPG